jgi:hypothetical protein
MPSFFDFVSLFGRQGKKRDLRFGGFRAQSFLDSELQRQLTAATSVQPPTTNQAQPKSSSAVVVDGPRIPDLGRSGQGYQLCYNLKSVVNKAPDVKPDQPVQEKDWSIHQAAIHHQFDVLEGTTLWITTSGNEHIQDAVEELTADDGRPEDRTFTTPHHCFKSSLAVHLLICHWSTRGWRERLRWLEDVVERQVSLSIIPITTSFTLTRPRRIWPC